MPLGERDLTYCLKTMEGSVPATGYMVLRVTSDIVSEAPVDGMPRREKLPRGPGGTYCGLIMLFSLRELNPVAMLHDGYIQVNRVACTSALGTRLLAREDAGDLALLGTGGQAWAHLQAIGTVRSLRRVRVFSPTRENRERFAERARAELGLAAMAVESARSAVEGADLVVAATNTSVPVVEGAWLAPGTHVVSIVSGDQRLIRRELDDEVPDDPHTRDADEIARHQDPQIARVDDIGRAETDQVRELLRVEGDDRADTEARADGGRRAADVDPDRRTADGANALDPRAAGDVRRVVVRENDAVAA